MNEAYKIAKSNNWEDGRISMLAIDNADKTNLRWGLLSRLFDGDMIDIEKECEIIGNIHEDKQ